MVLYIPVYTGKISNKEMWLIFGHQTLKGYRGKMSSREPQKNRTGLSQVRTDLFDSGF
jgi:hypothetical protein